MLTLALHIGIYSYLIFSLGLLGLFYKSYIVLLTTIYILIAIYFNRKILHRTFLQYFNVLKKALQIMKRKPFLNFLIVLIVLETVVNFIGVLGPELGFDALWYHLTIPKVYLENHSIHYIPGGLFYYSAMPKLGEMLYISALSFGDETIAKFIHFFFGILSLIALYNLSRKFLSKTYSLLVLVLFYSNLVVGWISVTAYVDLARTFFEIMALWGFLEWMDKKNSKWLIESAVMLGLAISTKLLALGSLLIFTLLIIIYVRKITKILVYWFICLLVPLPWFVFSYINTGNPIYPFFSNIYPVEFNFSFINPLNLSDPINPLYIILVPIGFLFFNKQDVKFKMISFYSVLSLLVWQLTPNTGGGRFLLPYLPAFSMLSVWVIREIWKLKIRPIILGFVIFFSLFSIVYRFGANLKYIPVIVGSQSESDFLKKNLNFSFGNFYDTDGYFTKKISQKDMVLLYGFHNLYYVNFPFIDSSYVKKGDMFNYIAVQGNNLHKRFKFWNLIYYNEKTDVKLYSIGGLKWIY